MRISELGRVSGVSVPTLKYYLREGLLPPGTPTAPNQATYGEEHVHRLRLIRVLREVGGLGIAQVRDVIDAISDERVPVHRMLGVAHHAIARSETEDPPADDVSAAMDEIGAWLERLGWRVTPGAPGRRMLAEALAALRRLGRDEGPEVFEPYAEAADRIAAHELGTVAARTTSRQEGVERVVVGTVVFDRALRALRMLAQEHHSAKRFGERYPVRRRASGGRL